MTAPHTFDAKVAAAATTWTAWKEADIQADLDVRNAAWDAWEIAHMALSDAVYAKSGAHPTLRDILILIDKHLDSTARGAR